MRAILDGESAIPGEAFTGQQIGGLQRFGRKPLHRIAIDARYSCSFSHANSLRRRNLRRKSADPLVWLAGNTISRNEVLPQGGPLGAMLSRSEEHTSELQSLMRISHAAFCLKK